MRSNARPQVRTRSIGTISDSIARIGLIRSVEPIHAWAPPIRPPRRRNSSVSTAKRIFSSSRTARARAAAACASAPSLIALAAATASRPRPAQTLAESTISIRSGAIPRSVSWSRACSAERTVPEMPPEMWIETMSDPCSSSGS